MILKKDSKNKYKKKNNKNSKSNKTDKNDVCLEFDYGYLDDHHRAVLSALVLSPDIISLGSSSSGSSNNNTNNSSNSSSSPLRIPFGLVVGLGGGAMPMCMQRYLPGIHM